MILRSPLYFICTLFYRCSELTEENCKLQEDLADMQRELEAYQDEEGEVVLKLRQELAQVQSHLQESNDKLELAQSKSAKAEQVRGHS